MSVDTIRDYVMQVWNNFSQKLQAVGEKLETVKAVAEVQSDMLLRRAQNVRQKAAENIAATRALCEERLQENTEAFRQQFEELRLIWQRNQHFSLWVIPADGQKIAKKSVNKNHLKYAAMGVGGVFFVMLVSIGVLAHFAVQSETQRQELLEYQRTKLAQEQKISELQQVAEKNQQELAYLSKLDDKVRAAMAKNGTQLPPKSDAAAYAGKGGASMGQADQLQMVLKQEQNIQSEAKARRADLEGLLQTIENDNYRKDATPSHWPTGGGFVTSYFGGRANPFDGYSADWHSGIDIANDYGAPVYAAAAGYVAHSGWYGGYGRYVRLNHDLGYVTAYGHMSSLAVSAGSYVKKGDIIGYVGSSGNSTGPHLHFEVYKNGVEVNPMRYVG